MPAFSFPPWQDWREIKNTHQPLPRKKKKNVDTHNHPKTTFEGSKFIWYFRKMFIVIPFWILYQLPAAAFYSSTILTTGCFGTKAAENRNDWTLPQGVPFALGASHHPAGCGPPLNQHPALCLRQNCCRVGRFGVLAYGSGGIPPPPFPPLAALYLCIVLAVPQYSPLFHVYLMKMTKIDTWRDGLVTFFSFTVLEFCGNKNKVQVPF